MSYLKKVALALAANEKKHKTVFNYTIPDLWDHEDVCVDRKINVKDGNVIVNPFQFYKEVITQVILKNGSTKVDYHTPYFLGQPKKLPSSLSDGAWIRHSYAYSMMVRSSASYDHDRSGHLENENLYGLKETGTFVKAIALLPFLKRMGIDVVYMLPISKYSLKDKKGELGSPYGVSNFFKLDEGLKDPMTGDSLSVEDEFKAFVEACHRLDMKVIIDIIPRTNSVNSDLIVDHPEWFYWINHSDLADYKPPLVPTLDNVLPAKAIYLEEVFKSEEVIAHIKKFKPNPKSTHPKKWDECVKAWQDAHGSVEILDLVQDMFGLTIAPAFSDGINDPQPAWSDVTFFRLFLDHPLNSQPFLEKIGHVEPYILFDVAKSSYNPGSVINQPLWDTLTDIIPYFQRNFGIDGARIDMGHALPDPLITMILDKARQLDPNFCFIAEELDVENAKVSMEKGYNMIIGDGFIRLPRVNEGFFNSFVYTSVNMESPLFAVGETHDTPRLAAREGGEKLSKMVTLYSLFIPNTIPFLNSGQEVFERQPMNTGLDCRPDEAYQLSEDDPYYGKLALFDKYAFHMNHKDRFVLPQLLEKASKIRESYIESIVSKEHTYPLGFSAPWDPAAGMGFVKGKKALIAVVNTDFYHHQTHTVKLDSLPSEFFGTQVSCKLVFSSENTPHLNAHVNEHKVLMIHCAPAEVVCFELEIL